MEIGISLEHAFELIQDNIFGIKEVEEISLSQANQRILANDFYATMDMPPFNKSALDGYAFYFDDTKGASIENPIHLEVVDTIYAGDYFDKKISHGQAIHLMTGTRVPKGCSAVIRFEDTNNNVEHLEIYKESKYMDGICVQGEDYQKGELLLKKGTKLDYASLAVLASNGIDCISVYKKPKVALVITGDEIMAPGLPLLPGKIYDSNQILLKARLEQLGFETSKCVYVSDDANELADVFTSLSKENDIIFSTGAVSVGDKDIVHPALEICEANKVFWKLKLKPGSPTVFSVLNQVPILSLSGNPFAAICMFEILGRFVLSCVYPDSSLVSIKKKGILKEDYLKKSPNRRFVRAICKDGFITVPKGSHSNNELKTLMGCNVLIDIEKGNMGIKAGEEVDIWEIL